MNENETSSNEPVGDNEPQIREPNGTRRPMNATEARVFRERQEAAKTKPVESSESDAAEGQESPERGQQRDQPDDDNNAPAELEVPGETPQEHTELVQSFVEQLAPIAQELNLPVGDVQDVVDFAVGLAVTDRSNVSLEDATACYTVLTNRYGAAEAAKIAADAQAAVDRLGPKMKQFLNSTMLGNDPSVLYALAAYKRGDLNMSPVKAQAELDKLTKDPRGPYRNSDAAGHKSAVARANMLYRILAKAGGKAETKAAGEPKASKPTDARRASLERELKAAIAAPEYRKRGPGHAEAVSRVEKLYRDLYPGNRNDEGEDV